MKIAIAGTGYVGLVTAVCLAANGHQVTCVDPDVSKIEKMKKGISPIYEVDLENLMHVHTANLSYTSDYASAYKDKDVIVIGVGTPEKMDGSANLDFVYLVCEQIAANVNRDCVVIVKSTVPVGTNDTVEKLLRSAVNPAYTIRVASNPEFLAQGSAVQDTLHADRIVIGVEDDVAKNVLMEMYDSFGLPILVMNRRSAEMVKYASNDFLALKISYVNEIANLCESLGANITDVTQGMGMDHRIGKYFLKAGIGYGGSCFPKDTKALHWLSVVNGTELKTIKAAIEVNERQKIRLYEKAKKHFGSLKGKRVALLGLTFKPNTDDLRDAPSLDNVPLLLDAKAEIRAYDPVGIEHFKKHYPTEITYCDDIGNCLQDADICFIFTEWNSIVSMDINLFVEKMRTPIIYDGRNCFALDDMKKLGISYHSIGR